MTARARWLLLVALTLTATACGGGAAGSGAAPPAGAAGTAHLEGRTFLSTAVEGAPALVAGTRLSLRFADGHVMAHTGCNSMSGPYLVQDGRLLVEDLSTTEMACPDGRMEQDAWFAELLLSAPQLDPDGDRLTITGTGTGSGTTMRITMLDKAVAIPDRPLQQTTWRLDGYGSGGDPAATADATMSSVPSGVTSTLALDSGGALTLQLGCNTGSATATVTAEALRVSAIRATRMACGEDAMAVERAVTGVLTGESAYTVDGTTLTITSPRGVLTYRAD